MNEPLPKRLLCEFVGTFALVFMGCLSACVDDATGGALGPTGIGLVFGFIVLVMIYSVGEVSGAHFNPAVSLAFAISKRFPWREVGPYAAIQFLAAIVAAVALRGLFPEHETLGASLPKPGYSVAVCFALEAMLTLILVFVILSVALGSKIQGHFAGLAIGLTVALEAIAGGPICGASMNPARSLGPAVISGQVQGLWGYVVFTCVGAAVAVPLWYGTRATPKPAGDESVEADPNG